MRINQVLAALIEKEDAAHENHQANQIDENDALRQNGGALAPAVQKLSQGAKEYTQESLTPVVSRG